MRTDLKAFAAEYLLFAAVSVPWEVSEEVFTGIVLLLMNADAKLASDDRENCLAFFAMAEREAARVDLRAASPSAIYRAACESVKLRGCLVYPLDG